MKATIDTWDDIRSFYVRLGQTTSLQVSPILVILDWLSLQSVQDELYAHTSMHDLVLSLVPFPATVDQTLRIAVADNGQLTFTVLRHRAATDPVTKTVPASQAIETLRKMLNYKLGIYRKPE